MCGAQASQQLSLGAGATALGGLGLTGAFGKARERFFSSNNSAARAEAQRAMMTNLLIAAYIYRKKKPNPQDVEVDESLLNTSFRNTDNRFVSPFISQAQVGDASLLGRMT